MSRSLRCTVPALALLTLAGCTDSPLSPPDSMHDSASPALISPVPLIVLDAPNQAIELTVEVVRGLPETQIAPGNDPIFLEAEVSFSKGGTFLAALGTQQPLPPLKREALRGEGSVSIAVCINIPGTVQDVLVAADDGSGIDVKATVELVLVDGAGKEHVLDTEESTAVTAFPPL